MFGYRRSLFNDPFFKSFRRMGQLFSEMDRHLGKSRDTGLHAGKGFPQVDVWTSQEGVVVNAEIPGVATEDLDVSVLGDTLTIRGKRPDPELGEDEGFVRRERFEGEFVRTLQLPFPVNPDQVDAEHRHGVLTIKLARPESDKPRRIAIGNGS